MARSWRSAATVVPALRAIWGATRSEKERLKLSSVEIDSVVGAAKNDSLRNIHSSVANWLLIFDEMLDLFVSLYIVYFERTMSQKHNTRRIVYMMLTASIASNCFAIRQLVLSGYDVNAKTLARLLGEYIDTLILLLNRPELCPEFHRSQEPEDANKFWHKYLSKGKARREVRSIFKSITQLDEDQTSEIDDWRADEFTVLSAASHPSMIAAFFNVAHGGRYGKAGTGIFGNVDTTSVRTLRFCVFELGFLILIGRKLGLFSALEGRIPSRAKPFAKRLQRLQGRFDFVVALFLFIAREQDSPEFLVPQDDQNVQATSAKA